MESTIAAYSSLLLIILGTTMNILTLIILCRSTFRNLRVKPTIYYMRAIAVFDILMLYGWNFDHYLLPIHGFTIQRLSIPSCRLMSFLNYFTDQSSAWLRVFACIDRYLILSRPNRRWFIDSRYILILIASIILVIALLNLHFLIFGCSYGVNGAISVHSWLFAVYPLWDFVNLAVYNCIPFILMILFNIGVIYHLFYLRTSNGIQHFRVQHRSISITLLTTTFLFLIMTIPATVAFAFFSTSDSILLRFLDNLLYSYHITSFPLYLITFRKFRREILKFIQR